MERQFDRTCKFELLAEDVNDRGIRFYYDNESKYAYLRKGMTKMPCRVTLKTGKGLIKVQCL